MKIKINDKEIELTPEQIKILKGEVKEPLQVVSFPNGCKNFVGQKINHWRVLGRSSSCARNIVVVCDCGITKDLDAHTINKGQSTQCRACGVRKRLTTHGFAGTKPYKRWCSMISRCKNVNHPQYKNYGGRGIKVCERWKKFVNFYEDMGDSEHGYELDRVDVNGNYEKSNCRWATKSQNSNNKRNSVLIEYNGDRKTVTQWAREYKMSPVTLKTRISHNGMTIEEALLKPLSHTGRKVRANCEADLKVIWGIK